MGKLDGRDTIIVLPITSKPPREATRAVEIPDAEKRGTGLDTTMRLWIVVDEANIDTIGKSYYLYDQEPLGQLSRAFFLPVAKAFAHHFRSAMKTDRTR